MKKIISMVLVLCMVLGMSVSAWAEDVGGTLYWAYINDDSEGITFDVLNYNYTQAKGLKVALYAGEELLTYKIYDKGPHSKYGGDGVTGTFSYEPEYRDGSWLHEAYTLYEDKVPTTVVLYIDGEEVDRVSITSSRIPAESATESDYLDETTWVEKSYTVSHPVAVAVIGEAQYESLEAAVEAAENGDTIKLLTNITTDNDTIIIDKAVTIDLNNKTWNTAALTKSGNSNVRGNVTITNGNLNIISNADDNNNNNVFSVSANGDLILNNVSVTGSEFDFNGYVFASWSNDGTGKLTISNSTISLSDEVQPHGLYYSERPTSPVTITGSTITLDGVNRGFANGVVTIDNSTITMTNLNNGFNNCDLTIKNSTVDIYEGVGRGITVGGSDNVVISNSDVTIRDMEEGGIMLKAGSGSVTIDDCTRVTVDTDKQIVLDGAEYSDTLIKNDCYKLEATDATNIYNLIHTKNHTPSTPTVTPDYEEIEEDDDTESLVVCIKFDDVDESLFDEIKVNLLRNGKKYDSELLSASKNSKKDWRVEWDDLDEDYEWSVDLAAELEGYEAEIVNLRGNYWTITLSEVETTPVVSTEKANPSTGAADFVGVAVALAVVSAAGMGALSLKK